MIKKHPVMKYEGYFLNGGDVFIQAPKRDWLDEFFDRYAYLKKMADIRKIEPMKGA